MTSKQRNQLPNLESAIEQCRTLDGCEVVWVVYYHTDEQDNKEGWGKVFAGKMVFGETSEGKSCLMFNSEEQGMYLKSILFQYDIKEDTPTSELVSLGADYPEHLLTEPLRFQLGTYEQMIAKAEKEATEGYEIKEESNGDYVECRITNYLYGDPMDRESWSFGFSLYRCQVEVVESPTKTLPAEGDEGRKLEGIDWIKVQAGIEELESDLGEHKSNGWEYENLEYTVKLLKRLVDRNDRMLF